MFSAYLIHIAIIITIYIILAVSLNLTVGYTGLLNLGHIAFFGLGAYTSALLTLHGIPFVAAFVLAPLFTSLFGWLIVKITHRLKGDYLALATLGFSFVAYVVFLNWNDLTRGPLGLAGIPRPNFLHWHIGSSLAYLIWALIIMIVSVYVIHRIVNSRFGKLLEGVRDDEVGLAALGKNVGRLKCQSLMISAFFAAVAGGLFAHYIGYIDPGIFFLSDTIIIFSIVMVGGLASIRGSILACILIMALPELVRFVDVPSSAVGSIRQMIYAVILLIVLMFRPRGFFGRVDLD